MEESQILSFVILSMLNVTLYIVDSKLCLTYIYRFVKIKVKLPQKEMFQTEKRRRHVNFFINYAGSSIEEKEPKPSIQIRNWMMVMTTSTAMCTLYRPKWRIKNFTKVVRLNINKLYKLKVNIRRLDIILSLIVLTIRISLRCTIFGGFSMLLLS